MGRVPGNRAVRLKTLRRVTRRVGDWPSLGPPAIPATTAGIKRLVTAPIAQASLGDDLQRRDLLAFEFEEKPKIDGAARKVSGKPARDDEFAVFLLACQRLARVLVFGRGFRL